jgi:hypothetical protein
MMRWWLYSRPPLFWYWCEQRAGALWSLVAGDRASCWLDGVPAFFQRRYYTALNRMVKRTGLNLYGRPI